MSLQRYDFGRMGMEQHRNGDFVRFDDHDDALRRVNEELRTTISEMETVQERIRDERDDARRRICSHAVVHSNVFRMVNGRSMMCDTVQQVADFYGWDCYGKAVDA